ncbi:hypothetical protein AUJ69_02400 [Candidatus Woesearchaeota archaeon CG1_02_47_18]|nr:MAG: hypothetical protein AUJ69_02400 [Candidatus Woesearchaeota archaeon CG1_02_47_18]
MAKKKAEPKKAGTSVKSYKQDIDVEKQKMGAYSKEFGTTVRSLQAGFKKHAKDMNAAALKIREDGIKNMSQKVGKFKYEIKEATTRMADNVKFIQCEINKKKKDFQAYARGPFQGYIKAFWG